MSFKRHPQVKLSCTTLVLLTKQYINRLVLFLRYTSALSNNYSLYNMHTVDVQEHSRGPERGKEQMSLSGDSNNNNDIGRC